MADFSSVPCNPPHILHLNVWKLQLYEPPQFSKAIASFLIK